MNGRRRYPRFLLSTPIDGSLHVREDVAIERWGDEEIEVVSVLPSCPEEQLALELPGHAVGQITMRVCESRPVVASDGSICYRLRMVFDGSPNGGRPARRDEEP